MSDLPKDAELEEAEIAADEQAAEEIDEEESGKTDYIEFLGTDPQYGVEFYREGVVGHAVTPKDLRDAWGVTTPKKLEWTKMAGGPHKGRMLVPVSDMSPEAAEGFANDPMFRRVSL